MPWRIKLVLFLGAPPPDPQLVGIRPPWAARSPPNGSQGRKKWSGLVDYWFQTYFQPGDLTGPTWTSDMAHGTWSGDMDHGSRDMDHGTSSRDMDHGTWTRDMDHGTWIRDMDHGTWTKDMDHVTWTRAGIMEAGPGTGLKLDQARGSTWTRHQATLIFHCKY